jgi:DNA replication protein DnaC
VDDPNFGVLMTCQCKKLEKELRREEELRRLSNLTIFADKTFDQFDPDVPGVAQAYAAAREYARMPHGWFILMSMQRNGCGKTHLAAAIAHELLAQYYPVLFTVVPDLLDHLRSTFMPGSEVAYDERFEAICNATVLVLDDLGTENATPWAREKLYQIINHRYNNKMATVITTNCKPETIERRIFSRMSDLALCKVVFLEAGDYRKLTIEQRKAKDYRHLMNEERPTGAYTSEEAYNSRAYRQQVYGQHEPRSKRRKW